ncbi:MAG: hypothetical protein M0C28_47500 [Candidatus Moduliflexus flocculans]|nr:hypothetical protein [Candidatus Moduliflexus flocculans]
MTRYARERIVSRRRRPERGTPDASSPPATGSPTTATPDGNYWRMFRYIERRPDLRPGRGPPARLLRPRRPSANSRSMVATPARRTGCTRPSRTSTTPAKRFEALREALERDAAGRAAGVGPEIDFVLAREKRHSA